MVGTNDEILTNSNIRDIVKQVKEGKINKTDAFNELRNMLIKKEGNEVENIPPKISIETNSRYNSTKNEDNNNINNNNININIDHHDHHDDNDNNDDNIDNDGDREDRNIGGISNFYDNNYNLNTPRFSKEDRRLLINKLIEKKRQDRNLQASGLNNIGSNGSINGNNNYNNNNNNNRDNIKNNDRYVGNRYQNRYDDKVNRDEDRDEDEDEIYEDDSEYPEHPRIGGSNDDYERKISPSHSNHSHDIKEEFLSFREVNDASSISSSGIRSRGYNSSLAGYNSQERRRPHSAGTLRSNSKSPSRKSPAFTRRSMDDSKISDYRNHKLVHQANIIHNEMFKECTFTPKVKPLPSSYGPPKDKDVQFYDRVMRWQREKEIESTRRKSLVAHNEVDGCTFHPKINRNSARAAKLIRGTNSRDPSSASKDTSIRLYESNAVTQSQKSKFVEDERQKEEKIIKQECTFQPRLLTKKSGYTHVDPKYDKVKVPTVQELKERSPPPPKDCTFTPKVKGVRNSMSSAKLYLKMNVVDRLSKPVGSNDPSQGPLSLDEEQYFDDRGVMDVASFMGSNSGGYQTPTDRRRPSSAPRDRRNSNGNGNGNTQSQPEETEEEREARRQSFQAFLGRQSQTILRKDKKTEDIIRSSTPSFHPDVNPKSMKIVRQSRKGTFMDRVQQDVLRREQTTTKLAAKSVDPNHTFHPELSSRGAHMRTRSIYEMSRGDLHKKETNQRILRLKTEQEELKNLTFQPAINQSKNARSSLQLLDNPGGFLERYTIEQKQNEIERNKLLEEKMLNEMKDCTFAPQTKECPSYIKRIARSLSVVKAAKLNEGSNHNSEKPQWK